MTNKSQNHQYAMFWEKLGVMCNEAKELQRVEKRPTHPAGSLEHPRLVQWRGSRNPNGRIDNIINGGTFHQATLEDKQERHETRSTGKEG